MTESHYCEEHQTKFFKTAKMSGYAHPIKVNDQTVGWCNEDAEQVAKLEPVKPEPVPPQEEEEALPESKEMTKRDWADKDTRTRKSIERQKCLDCAVNWCVAKLQGGKDIKTIELITVAGVFESYIENGIQAKKKVD